MGLRVWCTPIFGVGRGRHKACPYEDLMGLAGRGLARHLRLGTCSNIDTRSIRHVVGEGALRGRSPRTREGRLGPTAQNCSGQWLVVSGQRRRLTYFRVESGLDMAPPLPEGREGSPRYLGCTLAPFPEANC